MAEELGSPPFIHELGVLDAQATLLGAEHLEGQNQYECAFCCQKVDAERQMRLRSLPPYLCISLQRFVFDLKVQKLHPLHAQWRQTKPSKVPHLLLHCSMYAKKILDIEAMPLHLQMVAMLP